jgi:hypothetical protein
MATDRRQSTRYDTSISLSIRFLPDGTPVKASAIEVGPNGMRIMTSIPLVEASYVHITIDGASNNTHCEGRVVWTQRAVDGNGFESGIDIQRWGGGVPGHDAINQISNLVPKKDRRNRRR